MASPPTIHRAMVYGVAQTAMGFLGLVATARGLRRLTLPRPTEQEALQPLQREILQGAACSYESFASLVERLRDYFAGEPADFDDVELDLGNLTLFRRRALQRVRAIPRGHVRSYRQVAAGISHPRSARAVGATMAANPICVLVPCHRVIASDGGIGGFGGGPDLKRLMLALEGVSLEGR